jgi:nucleotide-binding universal stress UspA family protein
VVEELTYLTGYDLYGGYTGDLIRIMRDNGARVLDEGLAIARAAGVEADTALFDKLGERLGEVVADAAREWKADLIVAGTHGRRGIGRLVLGSGAEQIIRLSPVPVLVVRAPEAPAHAGAAEAVAAEGIA